MQLPQLLADTRACTLCEPNLPLGAKPLLHAGRGAKLLIIGQAPGRRAHDAGTPWQDASGERLRDWLGLTAEQFFDPDTVALLPMGFCYPGTGRSGDLPPRPECAPRWHPPLLAALPNVRLTVLLGRHAIEGYAQHPYRTMTDAVGDHARLLAARPVRVALPHPSPRNNRWLAKHPWFAAEVLPKLRRRVRRLVPRHAG